MSKKPSISDIYRYVIYAYLLFMMTAIPLYMKDGYDGIGDAKYNLFICGTTVFMAVSAFFYVIGMSCSAYSKSMHRGSKIKVFMPDVLMLLFAIMTIVSYRISPIWDRTVTGEEGWHMGLQTMLLLASVYFAISFSNMKPRSIELKVIYGISVLVLTFISVLVILNRYSFYPLGIKQADPSFVSTIGNIDWFAGFWSITSPAVTAGYVVIPRKNKAVSFIMSAAVWISFLSVYVQGSESAMVSFAVTLIIMILFASDREAFADRAAYLLFIALGAAASVRVLYIIIGERLNYGGAVITFLSGSSVMLILFAAAVIIAAADHGRHMPIGRFLSRYGIYIGMSAAAATVIYVILTVLNSAVPGGIKPVDGMSAFRFDDEWGNSRGFIWRISLKAFGEASPAVKLFGAGPDGYAGFVYGIPDISPELYMRFGSSRLTNAHNTVLTMLIDNGIIGTFLFAAFIICLLKRAVRARKCRTGLYICITAALSYIACNMTGFQDVLNTPYAYICMGIAACCCRNYAGSREVLSKDETDTV